MSEWGSLITVSSSHHPTVRLQKLTFIPFWGLIIIMYVKCKMSGWFFGGGANLQRGEPSRPFPAEQDEADLGCGSPGGGLYHCDSGTSGILLQ